ncbi:phage tail protein [Pseudoalteromonas sp. SSDWG2]|uniref:phage tail protein n=1 Tax=Pseudoalteromonas sp. SSDWG2 TaxID=3139391 RepID=UPI003BAB9539
MEPFIAQIQPFGFNFAVRGWSLCEGQLLPISSNTALFSLIGTTYGGDGRTTFALPDLRGRSIIGQGHGPGLQPRAMGQRLGTETHNLNTTELPASSTSVDLSGVTGTLKATTSDATADTPTQGFILAKVVAGENRSDTPEKIFAADTNANTVALGGVALSGSVNVALPGGNQPFNIMQPSEVINYSIALMGIFPSRN